MATATNVVELLETYNDIITSMNESESIDATRQLALRASRLGDGINWGNGTRYIENIQESFVDISLNVGTKKIRQIVESVNEAIDSYSKYLLNSWWQFGDSNRNGKIDLPKVAILN